MLWFRFRVLCLVMVYGLRFMLHIILYFVIYKTFHIILYHENIKSINFDSLSITLKSIKSSGNNIQLQKGKMNSVGRGLLHVRVHGFRSVTRQRIN